MSLFTSFPHASKLSIRFDHRGHYSRAQIQGECQGVFDLLEICGRQIPTFVPVPLYDA